jgi:myo-inositol-1(or 4)-monophosphatase
VVDLNRDDLFTAVVEKSELAAETGAWLNDRSMEVSPVKRKEQGVVVTGFSALGCFETEYLQTYLELFQKWQKVRLLGSAALSLAWVSCGRADAFVEEEINIWDVAAGLALVKAAGGEIAIKAGKRKNSVTAIATNGRIPLQELIT